MSEDVALTLGGAHDHQVVTSSKNPNWRTTQPMREALHREFPLAIDLAATAENRVCEDWLGPGSSILEDSLSVESWAGLTPEYSYGFLNPPYARKFEGRSWPIEPWIERCWNTSADGRGIVAVLPAAIQTAWWRQYVYAGMAYSEHRHRATEIRILPHRESFDPPPGVTESQNANVNTAIVIWHPFNPGLVEPWVPHQRYWSYR